MGNRVSSRRALCIGVGSFTPPVGGDDEEPDLTAFGDLDYAARYTGELHAALHDAGYDAALVTDPQVLGAAELGERVDQHLSGDGIAVVHVLSHGERTDVGGVYVVGSDGSRSKRTRVEDWRIAVTDGGPTTLFLLDLCHAGAANRHWQPPAPGARERAWVIAAAGADQPAYAGRLTRAATTVITDITSGRADLAETVAAVGFDVLFERIRRQVRQLGLDEGGHLQDPVCTPVMGTQPDLPFFPNPSYEPSPAAEAAAAVEPATAVFVDPALDEEHFRDRAAGRGPAARRFAGGCFTGRSAQLRRLAAWMDGHNDPANPGGSGDGLVVVTGSPGVGKSALLGVLVCAAHPQLRESTRELWRAAAARPSENSGLVAVHARQRSLAEITASLGRQLLGTDGALYPGHTLYPGEETFPALPRTSPELIASIAGLVVRPVIVLDALDEALDHHRVVAELLVPLARARRPDGSPACRLLVGTRSWDEFAPLLALADETGEVIDLDAIPAEQRRHDLVDYVTALLELLPGYTTTAHSRGRRAFAAAVGAALVPDHSEPQPTVAHTGEPASRWGEFLVAALFTHTISLTQPRRLTDPAAAAALGAQVPRTLPEVLELDLATRPPSRWRRPLLTALAHSRGNGLPRSLLPGVVAVVAGQPDAPTAEQLGAELDALRFYLRTSADTEASALYRLFHQGLADHLCVDHQPARGGLAAPPARMVLDGLLASIPTQDGRRRWDLAAPYLLRHGIEHAATAGRVDELLDDPGFLVHADPTTLAPLLRLATTPSARLAAAVYRTSAGRHLERSPEQRRDVLAIDAARYGAGDLREAICALHGQPELLWQPRWATGGQISTALRATLTGPATGFVDAVACTEVDGTPVAVTAGGDDQTVRVWDLRAGAQVGEPLTGHTGAVVAVACTEVDGTPVAVTTGYDSTVRVWDLRAGAQIGEPLTGPATGAVVAVACTEVDGTPVAVTTGDDSTVRVWDLRAGGLQDVVELPTTIGAIAVGRGNVLVVGIGWDVVALAHDGGR